LCSVSISKADVAVDEQVPGYIALPLHSDDVCTNIADGTYACSVTVAVGGFKKSELLATQSFVLSVPGQEARNAKSR
jgi:hypothetical protein